VGSGDSVTCLHPVYHEMVRLGCEDTWLARRARACQSRSYLLPSRWVTKVEVSLDAGDSQPATLLRRDAQLLEPLTVAMVRAVRVPLWQVQHHQHQLKIFCSKFDRTVDISNYANTRYVFSYPQWRQFLSRDLTIEIHRSNTRCPWPIRGSDQYSVNTA
jgi:hypothetical protein